MPLQILMWIRFFYKYWSKMYSLKVSGEYYFKHQVNTFYAKFISTKPVSIVIKIYKSRKNVT